MSTFKFTKEQIVQAFLKEKEASEQLKKVKEYLQTLEDGELPDELKRSSKTTRSYDAKKTGIIFGMLSKDYKAHEFMSLLSPAKMEKAVDQESYEKTLKHVVLKVSNVYKLSV